MSLTTGETAENRINLVGIRKIKKELGITLKDALVLAQINGIKLYKLTSGDKALNVQDLAEFKTIVNEFTGTSETNRKDAVEVILPDPRVNVRDRSKAPERTIVFSGPTNSGKTYHGLQQLFEDYENNPDQVHVYCGPLRLLAYEVYNKMKDKYGEENVGFITGEEQLNPDAKLLATTCEMAPPSGGSLLLDEAHWLVDADRGDTWAKILLSHEYRNLYVLTAAEALPIIETLVADSKTIEHKTFERKTPVVYAGDIRLKQLQPKTAVVCFSRKTVYALARELQKLGKKVGVLYGALPLKVRKAQIQSYLDGDYDIMVTTDVIGHGINLPIDNLVFAQTEKFDGTQIRPLHIWEAAQIAGRAGRFGLSDQGKVYLATGLPWFSTDADLVKDGVLAAGGKIATDLQVEEAFVSPTLGDLGITSDTPERDAMLILLPALKKWQYKASKVLSDRVLVPADLAPNIENAGTILSYLNCDTNDWGVPDTIKLNKRSYEGIRPVPVSKLWQLISGPFDARLGLISQVAEWLAREEEVPGSSHLYLLNVFNARIRKPLDWLLKVPEKEVHHHMEDLEEKTKVLGEMKMVFVMFGEQTLDGDVTLGALKLSSVLEAEEQASNLITSALSYGIKASKFGKCEQCGKATAPYFSLCEDCYFEYQAMRVRY